MQYFDKKNMPLTLKINPTQKVKLKLYNFIRIGNYEVYRINGQPYLIDPKKDLLESHNDGCYYKAYKLNLDTGTISDKFAITLKCCAVVPDDDTQYSKLQDEIIILNKYFPCSEIQSLIQINPITQQQLGVHAYTVTGANSFLTPNEIINLDQNHHIKHGNYNIYKIGNLFYCVDSQNGYINKGVFGSVYKAFPINIKTGRIEDDHPVALKVCDVSRGGCNQQSNLQLESELLKNYYHNVSDVQALSVKNDKGKSLVTSYAFTMEYFDGQPLASLREAPVTHVVNTTPNPEIANLSFTQRIGLIRQAAMWLNLFHHESPSTGKPIVHSDIKPQNVLLVIRNLKNIKLAELIPVDLGLSTTLELPELTSVSSAKGTPIIAAPELYQHKVGPKTDVYAFVSLVLILLGANNPYVYIKNNHLNEFYNTNGLLAGFAIPNASDIRPLILSFIERMSNKNYEQRADSDEVLAFFTILHNYYTYLQYDNPTTNKIEFDQEIINEYTAKLIVLAHDCWNIPFETIELGKDEVFEKPIAQYDFKNNPHICNIIITLAQKENLTPYVMDFIINKNISAKVKAAINLLFSQNKLSFELIQFFYETENDHIVEQVATIILRDINDNNSAFNVLNEKQCFCYELLQFFTMESNKDLLAKLATKELPFSGKALTVIKMLHDNNCLHRSFITFLLTYEDDDIVQHVIEIVRLEMIGQNTRSIINALNTLNEHGILNNDSIAFLFSSSTFYETIQQADYINNQSSNVKNAIKHLFDTNCITVNFLFFLFNYEDKHFVEKIAEKILQQTPAQNAAMRINQALITTILNELLGSSDAACTARYQTKLLNSLSNSLISQPTANKNNMSCKQQIKDSSASLITTPNKSAA